MATLSALRYRTRRLHGFRRRLPCTITPVCSRNLWDSRARGRQGMFEFRHIGSTRFVKIWLLGWGLVGATKRAVCEGSPRRRDKLPAGDTGVSEGSSYSEGIWARARGQGNRQREERAGDVENGPYPWAPPSPLKLKVRGTWIPTTADNRPRVTDVG